MTSYYSRTAFTRNTLAKAEDVNAQLAAIQSGFEKLPTPHASAPTTKGFNEVFRIVDATRRDHPISAGQVQDQGVSYIAAGGTANALTATLAPAVTAYVAGMRVCVLAASTNTAAVTIDVNSVGAKAITKSGATALTGGEITAGMMVDLLYDGTQFQMTGSFSTSTVTMLDEDDMASDSATNTASQQSIKAYADTHITKALFDANTILAADSDDTPAALTVAEQRLVGRVTSGSIAALTAAQVRTLLVMATSDSPQFAGIELGHADDTTLTRLSAGVMQVQGVTIMMVGDAPTAHKDSHDPNTGGDALDCAAAANLDGVQAAAEGTADTLARSDHVHRIQHSISDNAIVTVDGSPTNGQIAIWTADGLSGTAAISVLEIQVFS